MTFFSQSRPHLLVVESDRVLRDVVGTALAEAGYVLTLAASPTEALALLETNTFDLILTDLSFRAKAAHLNSVARLRLCAQPIPVGLLTGWRLPPAVVEQQGFAWAIEKPFAVGDLLATIAASLRSSFSPAQAQQVELIKRYLAALAQGEWDVLRAICSPTLRYYPPRAGTFAPLQKIEGLEAYLAYARAARRLYVDYRLDHCVVFLQQGRFVTHYTSSWRSGTGARVSNAGTLLCRFAGERLSKIAVFMHRARLERLLASAEGTVHPFAAYLSRKPRPREIAASPAPVPSQRIGERLRAARLAAHLTQQELAGTAYSKKYLSAVERGKMSPSVQALSRLAERLGVTRSSLLGAAPTLPPIAMPEAPAADAEQAARLCEAERMVREGQYEEGIALFEQIGQRERTIWAYEQYAQFLAAQGRYQDAYEQMRRAIQRSRW